MLEYKVVELSIVTEENLEETVNEWTSKGWQLDMVNYVTQSSSRRPVMAFVYFTRKATANQDIQ